MANSVKPIPSGYHSVTPYLITRGADKALDYYKRAFGAKELMRHQTRDGKIGHAEILIGDSHIMLADEFPEMGARSPMAFGGSAVGLVLYVEDVDTVFKRAVAAGGKSIRPVEDRFYGDRSGQVEDPFGHMWTVSTHIEDLTEEEVKKRAETSKECC